MLSSHTLRNSYVIFIANKNYEIYLKVCCQAINSTYTTLCKVYIAIMLFDNSCSTGGAGDAAALSRKNFSDKID